MCEYFGETETVGHCLITVKQNITFLMIRVLLCYDPGINNNITKLKYSMHTPVTCPVTCSRQLSATEKLCLLCIGQNVRCIKYLAIEQSQQHYSSLGLLLMLSAYCQYRYVQTQLLVYLGIGSRSTKYCTYTEHLYLFVQPICSDQ